MAEYGQTKKLKCWFCYLRQTWHSQLSWVLGVWIITCTVTLLPRLSICLKVMTAKSYSFRSFKIQDTLHVAHQPNVLGSVLKQYVLFSFKARESSSKSTLRTLFKTCTLNPFLFYQQAASILLLVYYFFHCCHHSLESL